MTNFVFKKKHLGCHSKNMSSVKFAFGYCLVALMFLEVYSWTVDLKEVRKKYFDKIDELNVKKDKNDNYYGNDGYVDENKNGGVKYADKFEYSSYMEKKIQGIVHDGSSYLEGLRRSIERYTEMLENCTKFNSTMNPNNSSINTTWTPQIEVPTQNMNISASFMQNITSFLSNLTRSNMTDCRTVTRASEYVRRLAELATHTTKKLQDIAYAKKYEYYKDYTMEENELILKLAWFLDRLAYITGFEPEPRDFIPRSNVTTTPQPVVSLVNAPEDVKNAIMSCLDRESNEPATVRCRYPLPLPEQTLRLFNITEDSFPPRLSPSSSDIREVVSSDPDTTPDQSSLELLIATDDRPPLFYPHLPPKILRIRAIDNRLNNIRPLPLYTKIDLSNYPPTSPVKIVRKRSIEDNPLTKVMKYYVKHKVWINSNSDFDRIDSLNDLVLKKSEKLPNNFDVDNYLTVKSVQKRSIDNPLVKVMKYYTKNKIWDSSNAMKNSLVDMQSDLNEYEGNNDVMFKKSVQKRSINKKSAILRLPEDPTQDLSDYIKHKPGVNYNKDKLQSEKIIEYLKKLRNSIPLKNYVKKSVNRQRRSLHYENMLMPRESENPTKDLSFYVKNKEGTEYDSNLIQAGLVRAGLQQIFQTGNIAVVRRYGSNYNPLIPAPFYVGLFKSLADI